MSEWKNLTGTQSSSELNPKEHLWEQLERRLRARTSCLTSVSDLTNALLTEWSNLFTSLQYFFHALYYFILMIPELFFRLDMGPIVTHKIRLAVNEARLSILLYVVLCLQRYRSAVMHQSVVVQKTWHGGRNSKESTGYRYFTPVPPTAYFWVAFFLLVFFCTFAVVSELT